MNVPEIVRTPRLVLRRHTMADLDAFASFLQHPSATRFMAFTPGQKSRAGAEHMLTHVIASYESEDPILSLTIADPETDRYLGACGANPDGHDIEIYYTVVPEEQGRGIATEAADALVRHLRAADSTSRIVAYVVVENIASVRVAARLGFVDAGSAQNRARAGDLEFATLTGRKYVLHPEVGQRSASAREG